MKQCIYLLGLMLLMACNFSNKRKESKTTKLLKSDTLLNTIAPKKSNDLSLMDSLGYDKLVNKYKDSIDIHLSHFVKKKKDVLEGSAEGGEVLVYTDQQDTVKIKAIFYGEMGKAAYGFYFKNRKLAYLSKVTTNYKYPIGRRTVVVKDSVKESFTIKDGKVIIGKRGKENIPVGNYGEIERDIMGLYKELILDLNQ